MAVMAGNRIRTNNVFGTVTDNPLTNAATTINSAGLANLDAVASNHAVLILDPLRSAGAPEIVVVTAHTASATSATVTRGAYGTSARQHAQGVLWVHAPTIDDVIRICTSSTRPSDQYEGQLIYESDTDFYKGHNGAAWEDALKIGAWIPWTPTIAGLTLGNGTRTASYVKVGRTVLFRASVTLGSTSAVGALTLTLPVTAASGYLANVSEIGNAAFLDAGVTQVNGLLRYLTTTTADILVFLTSSTYLAPAVLSSTVPFTWATGDQFSILGAYEAAA